jgi:hypothetical protein
MKASSLMANSGAAEKPSRRVRLLDAQKNVYSQYGEDGIIGAILTSLPSRNKWCVEFGAWDGIYLSNTRNLIENEGYSAVLIEASEVSYRKLQENSKAFPAVVAMNEMVGVDPHDSLDSILARTSCPRDFDFLSIDIDGNDIHVWRAMKAYRPKAICIEFNPTIPTEVVFEQPLDPAVKWGSSLAAFVSVGKEKGYELVCCNELNAFFVANEFYPEFGLEDNSPASLRPHDAQRTFVFSGYDGTLISTGDVPIPWHGISATADDLQVIPRIIRKYPLDYNQIERGLSSVFHLYRRGKRFLKSRRARAR